jgi:hypothetical protein
MVAMPKGFLVLRVFQVIFALIVLGVCFFGLIYITLNALIINLSTVSTSCNTALSLSLTIAFRPFQ